MFDRDVQGLKLSFTKYSDNIFFLFAPLIASLKPLNIPFLVWLITWNVFLKPDHSN